MTVYENVDYDGLLLKMYQNSYVIDVREHSELVATGSLPNSINIPQIALPKFFKFYILLKLVKYKNDKFNNNTLTFTNILSICFVEFAQNHFSFLSELENDLTLSNDVFVEKYKVPKPNKENDKIVFSCARGNRSRNAAEIAFKLDYKRLFNYTGGWIEWSMKHQSA